MALSSLIALLQDTAPKPDDSMIKIVAGVLAVVLLVIIVLRRKGGKKKDADDDF